MTTVTAKPTLVEKQNGESDFVDEIAELLPAEQRPLWYRDMAHLRRLPPDDEMLRIARAMGFLAIVTRQAPAQIASERSQLTTILDQSVKAIRSVRQDVIALHKRLEDRLTHLPEEVSDGINPQAIAAVLSESLRQRFTETGLPETAKSLILVAQQSKQVAADFDRSSKYLANAYRVAAEDARKSLEDMRLTIQTATSSAKHSANELTHTFLREYKWSVVVLCSAALAVGFSLGILWYRWINSGEPAPVQNVVSLPEQPRDSKPAQISPRKLQHNPRPEEEPSQ
jgi:hypothetical protein